MHAIPSEVQVASTWRNFDFIAALDVGMNDFTVSVGEKFFKVKKTWIIRIQRILIGACGSCLANSLGWIELCSSEEFAPQIHARYL